MGTSNRLSQILCPGLRSLIIDVRKVGNFYDFPIGTYRGNGLVCFLLNPANQICRAGHLTHPERPRTPRARVRPKRARPDASNARRGRSMKVSFLILLANRDSPKGFWGLPGQLFRPERVRDVERAFRARLTRPTQMPSVGHQLGSIFRLERVRDIERAFRARLTRLTKMPSVGHIFGCIFSPECVRDVERAFRACLTRPTKTSSVGHVFRCIFYPECVRDVERAFRACLT
jgi:hypothetical protein